MKYFCLVFILATQAFGVELKGVASSLDGSKPLYTEIHSITLGENGLNKKIETKYFKPGGKQFAQMISDFAKSSTIPDVKFTDSRFEKIEELNFDESTKSVTFNTAQGQKKSAPKTFKVTGDMAAGQGFDNFVKINFDQLKNATVPLSFGVLSQMDFYSFKGYKKNDVDKNVIQFGIELSSFFLRMLMSELVLEYDTQTKQILSFKGLSNLLSDDGNTQNVLIKYQVVPSGSTP